MPSLPEQVADGSARQHGAQAKVRPTPAKSSDAYGATIQDGSKCAAERTRPQPDAIRSQGWTLSIADGVRSCPAVRRDAGFLTKAASRCRARPVLIYP